MGQMPKSKSYRNKVLVGLAKDAPFCMYCHSQNRGNVVLCHFNSIEYGKGMGVKAHDIPCYLCRACHDMADGRDSARTTMEERNAVLYKGVYNSLLWLLESGHLKTY